MKTSETWWSYVKNDQEAMHKWLRRQYIGEVTAASRILKLRDIAPERFKPTLERIAAQEQTHAQWVGELLTARGIELPAIKDAESRYWAAPLGAAHTFEQLAAAGSHAEGMRLARIRVIAKDPESPKDVAKVFAAILPEEIWHERAFAAMTSQEHLEEARGAHQLGLEALGLEA